MEFENRREEWEKLLQQKAQVSQSLIEEHQCKTCTCLNLLQLSLCADNCNAIPPGSLLKVIEKLVEHVMPEESSYNIRSMLEAHNLQDVWGIDTSQFFNEVQNLKNELEYLQVYDIPSRLEALSKRAPPEMDSSSDDISSKIEALDQKIKTYEESLQELASENGRLREQLRDFQKVRDDISQGTRKTLSDIQEQIDSIKEDHRRITQQIEQLNILITDNTNHLSQLRKMHPEHILGDWLQERNQQIESQKQQITDSQAAIQKFGEKYQETLAKQNEINEKVNQIEAVHRELKESQKQCKDLSRHSNNLLTAADSVYSAQQHFQDFQQIISQKLDELRSEVRILRSQREPLEKSRENYANEISRLRQQMPEIPQQIFSQESYHPGRLENNRWSCCGKSYTESGCNNRYKFSQCQYQNYASSIVTV